MNRTMAALAALLVFPTGAALAADGAAHQEQPATTIAQAAGDQMTEGEVRKVDKDAGKITLKHGEIRNLGMPPMTMVFRVKDPTLLEKVQAGSKVRFHATQDGGTIVVTAIEPTK